MTDQHDDLKNILKPLRENRPSETQIFAWKAAVEDELSRRPSRPRYKSPIAWAVAAGVGFIIGASAAYVSLSGHLQSLQAQIEIQQQEVAQLRARTESQLISRQESATIEVLHTKLD